MLISWRLPPGVLPLEAARAVGEDRHLFNTYIYIYIYMCLCYFCYYVFVFVVFVLAPVFNVYGLV